MACNHDMQSLRRQLPQPDLSKCLLVDNTEHVHHRLQEAMAQYESRLDLALVVLLGHQLIDDFENVVELIVRIVGAG